MKRPPLALVLLLLVTAILAGCVGEAQTTARKLLDEAEAELARTAVGNEEMKDSRLVGAWCFEGDRRQAYDAFRSRLPWRDGKEGDPPLWDQGPWGDSDIGDGKCDLWAYRFVSPSGLHGLVRAIDREGSPKYLATTGPQPALGEWKLDSDDAIRRARGASQNLDTVIDRDGIEGLHVAYVLSQEDRAVWRILASDGILLWSIGVDAMSGKVLGVYEETVS